jgi:hypothetical protein
MCKTTSVHRPFTVRPRWPPSCRTSCLFFRGLLPQPVVDALIFFFKVNYYSPTYSVVRGPPWKADSRSAGQKTLRLLWNPKVHFRVHKNPPLNPIINQTIPFHPICIRSAFNICLPSKPKSVKLLDTSHLRGCILKFPDWVDNEIYAYNNRHSLSSNAKDYGGKTH